MWKLSRCFQDPGIPPCTHPNLDYWLTVTVTPGCRQTMIMIILYDAHWTPALLHSCIPELHCQAFFLFLLLSKCNFVKVQHWGEECFHVLNVELVSLSADWDELSWRRNDGWLIVSSLPVSLTQIVEWEGDNITWAQDFSNPSSAPRPAPPQSREIGDENAGFEL